MRYLNFIFGKRRGEKDYETEYKITRKLKPIYPEKYGKDKNEMQLKIFLDFPRQKENVFLVSLP